MDRRPRGRYQQWKSAVTRPPHNPAFRDEPPSSADRWPGGLADTASPQDATGREIEELARARLFGRPAAHELRPDTLQPGEVPTALAVTLNRSTLGAGVTPADVALAATVTASPGDATPSAPLAPIDLERGTLVGRYVVLSKLGAGGMGVVFAAYDPELDRKVALKLLHPRLAADADPATSREARARLVREAQALAKLNHPHIVAIHDVGEHQGTVWLAMEHVDGETLSVWLKRQRCTWREVLAVLIPVAQGLSAAHGAGLVHRDIKPDNIMIGADGRVRVMDLGLVRALDGAGETTRGSSAAPGHREILAERMTRAGAVMGTPAYMSPEQFRGQPVDARSDVFSFCVTLWEALMGERPFAGDTLIELVASVLAGTVRPIPRDPYARRVPGWLRRMCLRGLAVEPARRFPSMHALLDAMSHGRARARTHNWLAGAATAIVLGMSAALYQHHDRAQRIAACEQAGAGVLDMWNEDARAAVRAGILATNLSYASVTADKVMPFLDAQAEAWREHRTQACILADIDGTLAAEEQERAVWCLDERRMELEALLTELSHADEAVVQKAVTTAASLPPVSTCTEKQVLAALPSPPPADARAKADAVRAILVQAGTLLSSGKYSQGLRLTRGALADAQALGWPPMTAAARQLEGYLLERTGAYAEAEAASMAAYMEAAKVQAWHVAARAARDLIFIVGFQQARHAEGKVWAGHAEVAASLAGDPLGLREAERLLNLANVHNSLGEYTDARGLYERGLVIFERALGPEHANVITCLDNLANIHKYIGAYEEAKNLSERALAVRVKSLGSDHPDVAASLTNLAGIHFATGAYVEAKNFHERALVIAQEALGPDHPHVATILVNLAGVTDVYAEAKSLYERALLILEKTQGPEHPIVASTLWGLGSLTLTHGQPTEALALLERAVAIYGAREGTQQGEPEARYHLARALVRTGGDRSRAVAEARKAADVFRQAGEGMTEQLAAVETFLAEHRDGR